MTASRDLADIARQAWELKLEEPYFRMRIKLPVERLKAGSLHDAERAVSTSRDLAGRLQTVELGTLTPSERLTHGFLVHAMRQGMNASDDWKEAFGITPYTFGFQISTTMQVFQSIGFHQATDGERLRSLIRDFAAMIDAQRQRVAVQAARGWRIPVPALPNIRTTLQRVREQSAAVLRSIVERGHEAAFKAPQGLKDHVDRMVADEVTPAFDQLIDAIGPDYERDAPTAVGLWQYPGGSAAYRRAINNHLTLPLDPEVLHQMGRDEVARITAELAEVRSRMGGASEEYEFHASLRSSPRCFAASPEALEATYRRHMGRMAEQLPNYFRRMPQAPCGVARLTAQLEAGMSYGYYEPPLADATGIYYYNGSGLESRLQLNAAALIFHELAPGHHFHVSLQAENENLPLIRREFIDNVGFVEGWAEYASSLGDEMGLYDDDHDRYGRLIHERFVAQRLVVDTGLNALKWPLDKARAYMREQTLESESLIANETLRYATDMPAQALGYQFGQLKFWELRKRAQSLAGSTFDVRDFHDAILGEGCLPFPVLETHIVDTFSGQ